MSLTQSTTVTVNETPGGTRSCVLPGVLGGGTIRTQSRFRYQIVVRANGRTTDRPIIIGRTNDPTAARRRAREDDIIVDLVGGEVWS